MVIPSKKLPVMKMTWKMIVEVVNGRDAKAPGDEEEDEAEG